MKKFVLILLITLTAPRLWAQQLAVSSDILKDGLMIPNIGIEVGLGKSHFSERSMLGLHGYICDKPWGKDIHAWGIQPEYRYFFSGRAMSQWFVGAGMHLSQYDVTWAGKVYEGNSIAAGLIFGYVFNITNRLNIDIHSGFGYTYYRQKEYFVGDFYDADYSSQGKVVANVKGSVLLPTRMGVSISYILK